MKTTEFLYEACQALDALTEHVQQSADRDAWAALTRHTS